MKHFYKLLFCTCIFILPSLNSLAQVVVETVLIDENFDDHMLDENLNFPTYSGWGMIIEDLNASNSPFYEFHATDNFSFNIFNIQNNLLYGYDSLIIHYDVIPGWVGNGFCNSNKYFNLQLSYSQIDQNYNLDLQKNIFIYLENVNRCQNNDNTLNSFLIETIIRNQNPTYILSGYHRELSEIFDNNTNIPICSENFMLRDKIHCACDITYPNDQNERTKCKDWLSSMYSEVKFGIDNLKITGYKTEITTNTTAQTETKPTLVMITNLLGQTVNQANNGKVYLYHYSNGSVEKIIKK